MSEATVWGCPLTVAEVPAQGVDMVLTATPAERAALAGQNGLAALASAEARLHVARRGREGLHVTGELRARVTQTCVVTLENFESDIVEPIDVEFEPARDPRPAAPRGRRGAARPEEAEEEGMEDLDAPDPIVDGRIDLGVLASEFLTLGVDPYPRKPGAAFEEQAPAHDKVSPFAKLAGLAPKGGGKSGA